jgi:uncharacterized protein with NRDE domain
MCLLIAGYKVHPHYPLIVAANREELYRRPTEAAHWWRETPGVLGGRDAEAGGTWMGMNAAGRFAALTNYWESEPPHSNPPSRGELVRDFLRSEAAEEAFLEQLRARGVDYNGFNLLFGTPERLFYYSNRSSWSGALGQGIHVISNRLLNTPWPKSERARRFFSHISLRRNPDPGELLRMLDDVTSPDEQRDPATSRLRRERLARESIRIVFPGFGTRASTVLTVDDGGHVRFAERSYNPEEKRDFSFRIP